MVTVKWLLSTTKFHIFYLEEIGPLSLVVIKYFPMKNEVLQFFHDIFRPRSEDDHIQN